MSNELTIGVQYWIESDGAKTGWISMGWETTKGEELDMNLFELVEVIETDKFGNPHKATFKLIIL